MKTAYIVTSGEYSDYRINAVFDSKELANKFISSFNSNHYFEIEEYELNPFEPELNKDYLPFFVRMSKDGVCDEIHIEDNSYGFDDTSANNYDIRGNLYCHIFAKNKKHAIKIVNDRRTKLIAANLWKS